MRRAPRPSRCWAACGPAPGRAGARAAARARRRPARAARQAPRPTREWCSRPEVQVRVDDDVDAAGVEVLLLITHRGQNELGEAGGPKTLTTNCSRAADRGTSSSAHTNRTGGVDQDVDTTFLGEDLLDAGLHRSVVADVRRQGLDAPLAECSIRSIAGLPRTSWSRAPATSARWLHRYPTSHR